MSDLKNYLALYPMLFNNNGDKKQAAWHQKRYDDAVDITFTSMKEVFGDDMAYIKAAIRPKKHECYKNAFLLAQLYPDKVEYCEGIILVGAPINHAFNKVGDKYVDITSEMVNHNIPKEAVVQYTTDYDNAVDILLEQKVYGELYEYSLRKHFGY